MTESLLKEAEDSLVRLEAPEMSLFERLAKDPSVDVAKLEKLIAMNERILAHQAKAEFDAAFSAMQGEIPEISERGQILVNGQLRSKYATNEDIQAAVKPILQRHGFSLRFRHEFTDGQMKIIGILSHRSGHSEHDEFIAQADKSGSKNDIQALGSTRSYGQRYTTCALLNIATRGEDDDGAKAGRKEPATSPEGFEGWWADMQSCASEGTQALSHAWNQSKSDYRAHLINTNRQGWEKVKAEAAKVRS